MLHAATMATAVTDAPHAPCTARRSARAMSAHTVWNGGAGQEGSQLRAAAKRLRCAAQHRPAMPARLGIILSRIHKSAPGNPTAGRVVVVGGAGGTGPRVPR